MKPLYLFFSRVLIILLLLNLTSCQVNKSIVEATDTIIIYDVENNVYETLEDNDIVNQYIEYFKTTSSIKTNKGGGAMTLPSGKTISYVSNNKTIILIEKWIEENMIIIHVDDKMYVGTNPILSEMCSAR